MPEGSNVVMSLEADTAKFVAAMMRAAETYRGTMTKAHTDVGAAGKKAGDDQARALQQTGQQAMGLITAFTGIGLSIAAAVALMKQLAAAQAQVSREALGAAAGIDATIRRAMAAAGYTGAPAQYGKALEAAALSAGVPLQQAATTARQIGWDPSKAYVGTLPEMLKLQKIGEVNPDVLQAYMEASGIPMTPGGIRRIGAAATATFGTNVERLQYLSRDIGAVGRRMGVTPEQQMAALQTVYGVTGRERTAATGLAAVLEGVERGFDDKKELRQIGLRAKDIQGVGIGEALAKIRGRIEAMPAGRRAGAWKGIFGEGADEAARILAEQPDWLTKGPGDLATYERRTALVTGGVDVEVQRTKTRTEMAEYLQPRMSEAALAEQYRKRMMTERGWGGARQTTVGIFDPFLYVTSGRWAEVGDDPSRRLPHWAQPSEREEFKRMTENLRESLRDNSDATRENTSKVVGDPTRGSN